MRSRRRRRGGADGELDQLARHRIRARSRARCGGRSSPAWKRRARSSISGSGRRAKSRGTKRGSLMRRTITLRAGRSALRAATSDQPRAVPVSKRSAKIRFVARRPRARVAERGGQGECEQRRADGRDAAGRTQRRSWREAIERERSGERAGDRHVDVARRIVLVEEQHEELVGVAADRVGADLRRHRSRPRGRDRRGACAPAPS